MYKGDVIYNQSNPPYENKINNRYVNANISIPPKLNSNSPHILNCYFSSEEENYNLRPNYILTDNTRYTSKNTSKNSSNRYEIINQVLNENTISYSKSQYDKYGNYLYPEKKDKNRNHSIQNEEFVSKQNYICYPQKEKKYDYYGRGNNMKIKKRYSKHISPLNRYHNNYDKVSNYDYNYMNNAYNIPLTKNKSQNIFNHDNLNYKYDNILYREYNDKNGTYNNNKLNYQKNDGNMIIIDNRNRNENSLNGKSNNNFVEFKNYRKISSNVLRTKDIIPYNQNKNNKNNMNLNYKNNNNYNNNNKLIKRICQKENNLIINTECNNNNNNNNNNKAINNGIQFNNRIYDSKIDRHFYLSNNSSIINNTTENSRLNKNYSLCIIKYSSKDLQKAKKNNYNCNIINNYNTSIKKGNDKNEKKNSSIRNVNLTEINKNIKDIKGDKKIYIIEKKVKKEDEIKNNSILDILNAKNENYDYINNGRYHKNNRNNTNNYKYVESKMKKDNKVINNIDFNVYKNFINERSKKRINLRKNSSMLLNPKKYKKNKIEKINLDCFSYISFSKEKNSNIKKLKKSKKKYSKLNLIQLSNIHGKIYDEDLPKTLHKTKNKEKVLKPQISLRLSLFGIKKPERKKYYIVNIFYSENLRNKIDTVESDF